MSFLKEGQVNRHSRRFRVSDAVFVIDGNGFAHWICNKDRIGCPCPLLDTDYSVLRDMVVDFLHEMKEAGATCVFIFDSFVTVDKLATKFSAWVDKWMIWPTW